MNPRKTYSIPPPKPPRPPRELCNSYQDYVLGIVSPSKLFRYKGKVAFVPLPPEVAAFFKKEARYHGDLLRWKIETRQLNSYEWKVYYRNERIRRRTECEQHTDHN